MYSTTYVAVIVNILSMLLPKIGVTIGTEQLTSTLQVLVAIGSGLWVLIQRHKQGDITVAGVRKN